MESFTLRLPRTVIALQATVGVGLSGGPCCNMIIIIPRPFVSLVDSRGHEFICTGARSVFRESFSYICSDCIAPAHRLFIRAKGIACSRL